MACGPIDFNPEPDLVGIYRMSGTSPNGDYTGAVEIIAEPEREGTYLLKWVNDLAPTVIAAVGVGYIEENVFVVIIRAGNNFQLGSYFIIGDQLIGHWIMPQRTGLLEETLRKTGETKLMDAVQPKDNPRIRVRAFPGGRSI